jgi:hypothetical protein
MIEARGRLMIAVVESATQAIEESPRVRKAILLIPLVLALVSVTGCGEDDSNEPSARADDDPISKREYIARSAAICERTGQKASEEFKRMVGEQGPPPPGEERRFLANAQRFLREAAIPIIRENVDARRELPVPEGDEEEDQAIIAAGENALAGFEQVAADKSRVRALFEGKIPDPAKKFDALSSTYGIDKCGGDR